MEGVLLLMEHVANIRPNPALANLGSNSRFSLEATCSCQWQALSENEDIARNYIRQHLFRHRVSLKEIDKLWPINSSQ